MVERKINEIDFAEALKFAQRGSLMAAIGIELGYPAENPNPPFFELLKPRDGEMITPLTGVRKIKAE